MKITITGSLGHIGKPLTEQLVNNGHHVKVISHSPKRKEEIEELGAIPAIGSLQDKGFLVSAFAEADAVFTMNPPDYSKPDIREFYRETTTNYAEAIQKIGVKRVVHLSSFGAHLDSGTGPILGSHYAEEILKKVPNISLTFLRPTYFYYNLFRTIEMIDNAGKIFANYGAGKIPLVSPKDIAAVAAEELIKGKSDPVRYIASSEHTGQEIAAILGKEIDRPDLEWAIVPDEQVQKGMEHHGLDPDIAQLFTEMYQSLESGRLTEDYVKNKPTEMGKVKLNDFAKDFAKAYHKK